MLFISSIVENPLLLVPRRMDTMFFFFFFILEIMQLA